MMDLIIDGVVRVSGRRVPVWVVSRSQAWAEVVGVPTKHDNAWKLIPTIRRVATARVEAPRPGDALWWQGARPDGWSPRR